MSFDLKALASALDTERSQRGLTWSGVARELTELCSVKVSPSTIKGVGERARAEGDGVLQMLLWLERAPESFVIGWEGDFSPLRPAVSGKVLRWDTAALFSALNLKRETEGLTWSELAVEIGDVSPQQLKGFAKGGRTSVPDVMRVIGWLGVPASSFTRESTR